MGLDEAYEQYLTEEAMAEQAGLKVENARLRKALEEVMVIGDFLPTDVWEIVKAALEGQGGTE